MCCECGIHRILSEIFNVQGVPQLHNRSVVTLNSFKWPDFNGLRKNNPIKILFRVSDLIEVKKVDDYANLS